MRLPLKKLLKLAQKVVKEEYRQSRIREVKNRVCIICNRLLPETNFISEEYSQCALCYHKHKFIPTSALPGTKEKIEVLCHRASLHLPLFHIEDATGNLK